MSFSRVALPLFALLIAGSASAQQAAPLPTRRAMNPIAVQGPPERAVFAKAMGLTADQAAKYGHLRTTYLAATKLERDSLASMRSRMRASREAGGEPGRRGAGMQALRPLVDTLEVRFADFETDLAFLLTADQQKRYEAWKAAEVERMRSEMRARRP